MKIVEATIAVLIVIAVLLVISSRSPSIPQNTFDASAYSLLDEIARDELLRNEILLDTPDAITSLQSYGDRSFSDIGVSFQFNICDLDEACEIDLGGYSGDVYVYERVVSATTTSYGPKKVRLFLWK